MYLFIFEFMYLLFLNSYNMTGRAIRGNNPIEIYRISPTEGRDDTEVENGIFPSIARTKELQ